MRNWFPWLALGVLLLTGCGRTLRYAVVPAAPHYLLRSPDGKSTAFPDTTVAFSHSFDGWVDLQPGMVLRVERAYFLPAESRCVQDYVGLESMQLRLEEKGGFQEIAYQPLVQRPPGQPPVRSVISEQAMRRAHHRFFFQVVLDKSSGAARAVVVSGNDPKTVAACGDQLLRGDGCGTSLPQGVDCTAIPEGTAASLLFTVTANGKPAVVLWGSTVSHLIGKQHLRTLLRPYRGRLRPVALDAADPMALRLPLLPGDVLTY